MIVPVLFAGRAGSPILLRVGIGYVDDDAPYNMVAESDPIAIAGPGGEVMFTMLYLTTKHFDADVSVWVTPIIDGVSQTTQRIDLTAGAPGTQAIRQSHEIDLSEPYIVAAVEQGRTTPRGTWFSVRIETKYGTGEPGAAVAAAKQIVESVEVEYEILQETQQPEAVTP